jgi:hypothetical protein
MLLLLAALAPACSEQATRLRGTTGSRATGGSERSLASAERQRGAADAAPTGNRMSSRRLTAIAASAHAPTAGAPVRPGRAAAAALVRNPLGTCQAARWLPAALAGSAGTSACLPATNLKRHEPEMVPCAIAIALAPDPIYLLAHGLEPRPLTMCRARRGAVPHAEREGVPPGGWPRPVVRPPPPSPPRGFRLQSYSTTLIRTGFWAGSAIIKWIQTIWLGSGGHFIAFTL